MSKLVRKIADCLLIICLIGCTDGPIHTKEAEQTSKPIPKAPLLVVSASTRPGAKGTSQALTYITRLFERDPSLLAARLQIASTVAQAEREAARFRPNASITAGPQTNTDDIAQIRVSHPIYDFGKRSAELARLAEKAKNDEVALSELQHVLAEDLLSTALEAKLARARIKLLRNQISSHRDALERTQALSELDVLGSSEVRLAQIRLDTSQQDLRISELTLAQAHARWAKFEVAASPPDLHLSQRTLERFEIGSSAQASSFAKKYNVALLSAQSELSLRQAEVDTTLVRRRPTLGVAAAKPLSDQGFGDTSAGLTLEFPVFSKENKDDLKTALESVDVQSQRIKAAENDLEFEIAALWQSYQSSAELVSLERQKAEALKVRADELEGQVSTGAVPLDRVIEARSDQFDTELEVALAQNRAEQAILDILLATGVLTAR